jgi:hypothetical protein
MLASSVYFLRYLLGLPSVRKRHIRPTGMWGVPKFCQVQDWSCVTPELSSHVPVFCLVVAAPYSNESE